MKKRTNKLFSLILCDRGCEPGQAANLQKFFGSFFQKRTTSLLTVLFSVAPRDPFPLRSPRKGARRRCPYGRRKGTVMIDLCLSWALHNPLMCAGLLAGVAVVAAGLLLPRWHGLSSEHHPRV